MKKFLIVLMSCGLMIFGLPEIAKANIVEETTVEDAQNFSNDFLKGSSYYKNSNGDFVFTKITPVTRSKVFLALSEKEYVADCVVLSGETNEDKKLIENDIQKLKSENNISTYSSGGNNYKYKWDKSGSIKAFTRVYYNTYESGSHDAIKITKVTGGYTTGSGNIIIGSGVKLKSQTLKIGQSGKLTTSNKLLNQIKNYNITGRSWSKTTPTTWKAVCSDVSPVVVGATYSIELVRGTGTRTWTVEVINNLAGSGF